MQGFKDSFRVNARGAQLRAAAAAVAAGAAVVEVVAGGGQLDEGSTAARAAPRGRGPAFGGLHRDAGQGV